MNTRIFSFRSVLIAGLAVSGCKTPLASGNKPDDSSQVDALSHDESAENLFLMFGSPGIGVDFLPAIKIDTDKTPPYFAHSRIGFKTRSWYDMTIETVLEETERFAAAVAERGTLVWFFTGHGYDAGELMVKDEVLKFPHIAAAVKRARASRPLKRLVVIVDACYSGNLIDGYTPVTAFNLTAPRTTPEKLKAISNDTLYHILENLGVTPEQTDQPGLQLTGTLFEELVVLVSAKKTETSNSDAILGSQMVHALTLTLKDATEEGRNFSIKDFFGTVESRTLALNAGKPVPQTPVFKIVPTAVGDQTFHTNGQSLPANPPSPPPAVQPPPSPPAPPQVDGPPAPPPTPSPVPVFMDLGTEGFKKFIDRSFVSGSRRISFKRDKVAHYYNSAGQKRVLRWTYNRNFLSVDYDSATRWTFHIVSPKHLLLKTPDGQAFHYECSGCP